MASQSRTQPDPYQILFPLGLAYALLAALVWPLHAIGWIGYPATIHWTLMIQGFLHCFVLGFLLTALPAFLHAEKTRPWETAAIAAGMACFGWLVLARSAAAQAAYLFTIAVLVQAAARRLPRRRGDPPEEFMFVALGFAFGIAGGALSWAAAEGVWTEPAPRFALHLLSKGMMLSIVLGVGGLLVPTFSAMREPLVIPGIARPGQRRPRRMLYVPLALALAASFALEAGGLATAADWVRAIAASVLGILVWKLFRRPGRSDVLSWTLWSAGWLLLAGLWLPALAPARAVATSHFVFQGGFGLLILGIATRVVVTHGGYPPAQERRVLRPTAVAMVALALLVRVAADFLPAIAAHLYGASGLLWILGWIIWARGALPCIVRRLGQPVIPADHPQRVLLERTR
jgi:uncharacterized protein involved in response to NO